VLLLTGLLKLTAKVLGPGRLRLEVVKLELQLVHALPRR
jgi:hypothetical protein